jgi:glycosyltransferase involved in cell wall biosynthesis
MRLISVIVPFQNSRAHLHRCIESLLRQTLRRDAYELIFVDNNSHDGGGAIVARYPGVELLAQPLGGSYAARNHGLTRASGEIIAFTDSDCEAEKNWLERIANEMGSSDVFVVLGQRTPAADRGLLNLVSAYESQKAAYVASRGLDALFFGHTSNMAVRRRVIDELGPFPEVVRGGDTIMMNRLVTAYGSHAVRYCPDIRVRHLEVDSLRRYYGKQRVYGASNERVRASVPYRPLNNRERWQIFRDTVRQERLSAMRGGLLLGLLVLGAFCYEWSRRVARRRMRIGGAGLPV